MRVYLGESESPIQQTASYDSWQNFRMRLNMTKELGIDTTMLGKEMAIALAIIHWQTQIDGMDAEFVLGSVATRQPDRQKAYTTDHDSDVVLTPSNIDWVDFKRRTIHMWVLDFDKANPISPACFSNRNNNTFFLFVSAGRSMYFRRNKLRRHGPTSQC